MSQPRYDLLAIGNAMVDVLSQSTDKFINAQAPFGMVKGAMQLVDAKRSAEIYAGMDSCVEMSGGSAGNTAAGFASFGGKCAYIGKVAKDKFGDVFRRDMQAMGVTYETQPLAVGAPTGCCLILVTPDAQRTMNTFLGAGLELSEDDIDADIVASAAVTYLEGYMFDPPLAKKAFRLAGKIAHDAGHRVSLSLSDSFCVGRHRDDFIDLVKNHVDILFANEAEIMSLYQTTSFEEAAAQAQEHCEITVLTRSEKGSVICSGGNRIQIAAEKPAKLVDTTGAGDQYAAGFLYGFTSVRSLAESGRLGALAAAEVISHMGPRPEIKYSELLKKAAA